MRSPAGEAEPLRTTNNASVGADAYIGPNRIFPAPTAGHAGLALQKPCRAAPICATDHRTSCNMSLRNQRARWLWQSASPLRRGRCLHRPAHRTTNNASVGRHALTPPRWCGGLSNGRLRAARPTQAFQHFRRGGRLCPPVLRRGNLRPPSIEDFSPA